MSPQFGRRSPLDPRGEYADYDSSRRRARIIGRIVVGFCAVVVLVGSGGVLVVHNILDKVHHGPSLSQVEPDSARPTPVAQADNGVDSGGSGKAKNILILGVDSREGENSGFQVTQGPLQTESLSDTTILAHLSADGKHVTLVSIPRDSVVDIPACAKVDKNGEPIFGSDGKPVKSQPVTALFNSAIERGGPLCTQQTLETLTGVRIDNYIEVDFVGLEKMSTALGGVPLTMCSAVHDSYTGLNLPAGPVNLEGLQALQFVRARHGFPGGDDLHRIQRQQQFMAAMARKALSKSNLWSFPSMLGFYNDFAGSLTTDMDNNALIHLALGYRHIDTNNIVFATVPTYAAPKDSKWYQHLFWDKSGATALFNAIAQDRPLNTTVENGQNVANITVAPGDISVEVLNGTATNNLAHDVAAQLSAKGFRIAGIDSATDVPVAKTTLSYPASLENSVKTVEAALAATPATTTISASASASSNVITLTIGTDWAGVATTSPSAPASSPASSGSPSASASIAGVKTTTASTEHCVEGG